MATCRFYETAPGCVTLGRVVVLPEYRGMHLGNRLLKEAEAWIREAGYRQIDIDSRVSVVGFYQKLGYEKLSDTVVVSGVFDCLPMRKLLK